MAVSSQEVTVQNFLVTLPPPNAGAVAKDAVFISEASAACFAVMAGAGTPIVVLAKVLKVLATLPTCFS